MADHPYEVRKSIGGKQNVYYACLNCGAALNNPIEQAGWEDECPDCGLTFVVPGADARAWLAKKRTAEALEKRKEEQEAERERLEREKESVSRRAADRMRRGNAARERLVRSRAARGAQSHALGSVSGPCFDQYWIPGWIRVLWICAVVLATVAIGIAVIRSFNLLTDRAYGIALLSFLVSLVISLFWLVLVRIALEITGVLFDILRELRIANQRGAESPGEATPREPAPSP